MHEPTELQTRAAVLVELARATDVDAIIATAVARPDQLVDLAATLAFIAADSTEVPGIDRPWNSTPHPRCPTCDGAVRETAGLICRTCGRDYGRPWYQDQT